MKWDGFNFLSVLMLVEMKRGFEIGFLKFPGIASMRKVIMMEAEVLS